MSTDDKSQGTISVDEAEKMTANWRSYLETSGQKFIVRSYSVPINSYQNLLTNNPDAESVRIYIGLTDANDPSTSQVLLVPIIAGKEKLYQDTGESNVYDLTNSCPPNCDISTADSLDR